MMIVCFGDGLGNQMFQYAFYKELKKRYYGVNIEMDIYHIYGPHMHNGFELDKVFNIPRNECSKKHAIILADYFPKHMKRYFLLNELQKVRRVFWGKKDSWIEQDDATVFYKEVFELNPLKSYIFRGNWINENYFRNVKKELFEDFKFKNHLTGSNKSVLQQINLLESVSVHIRRGDYLCTTMNHLGLDYYKKAFDIIEKKLKSPYYFFFSDDKSYIKENFGFLEKYFVVEGNQGSESYIDMQLMSQCKHNIIANSTFSFWGAYLNKNENKLVIAPKVASSIYREAFACSDWITI